MESDAEFFRRRVDARRDAYSRDGLSANGGPDPFLRADRAAYGREILAMLTAGPPPLSADTGLCHCGAPHHRRYPVVARNPHGRGFSSPVYHCSVVCRG